MKLIARQIVTMLACALGVQGGSTDFLPATDGDLDSWQINFNTLIQAGPGTYGLDASYAATLSPLSADYTAKLATATNPATRTNVTIADKDAVKAALKAYIRQGAKIVQASPAVTNEAKTALGLPIHSTNPSPVPTPTTFPVLNLAPIGPQLIVIKYADQSTPDSKRKPDGAAAMLLHYKVSATPITNVEDLADADIVTRQPAQKQFLNVDSGKRVYMAGQWVTRTGKEGPFSDITAVTVP